MDPLSKEDLKAMMKDSDPYEAISRMAAELILARRIAIAMKQARGQRSLNNGTSTPEMT